MAHAAVHWVINEIAFPSNVKPPARWLLVHIADRADRDTWACWPSHKLLAKDAGMSPRAVLDNMFVLEQAGILLRSTRFRGDGTRSTDLITLVSGYATIAPPAPESAPDDTNAAAQNHVTEPGKRTDVVLRAGEPFDQWWAAYPRKIAKVAARKAWKAVPAKIGLADLMELTQRFSDHVVGKDPEHVPHPATWLNGERWTDELPDRSQTDGRPASVDRSAARHQRGEDAAIAGAQEALDRRGRQRWRL